MQTEGSTFAKYSIPDRSRILDGIYIAVTLPEPIDGVQLLACGSAVPIERIFEELVVLGLPHPLRHINHRGGLIVDQSIVAAALLL